MRRYSHAFRVLMDQELFNLLAEASTKTGIPKSRFVRYAIQPFSYTELAPGTTDWNDVYRTDPDPEHPLKRGRQLNVMLTGDEYEMLCRAAFKLGIARSAWVRERVYALLCRSYADELSPLTDARMREDDIPKKGRAPSHSWKKASPRTIIHPHAFSYALIWIYPWTPTWTRLWTPTWICPWTSTWRCPSNRR